MIWKRINYWKEEELKGLEEKEGIKIPKEDRKYLKVFQGGKAMNILFNIKDRSFYVECNILGLFYANMLTNNYFSENRKIVTLIDFNTYFTDGIKGNLVCYDFTQDILDPDILFISYIKKKENYGRYEFVEDSIKEIKIGKRIKDLFEYMYITDKKQQEAEVGKYMKINSTDEEIEKFENEIGIKFPEKYIEFLKEARKGFIRYPMKFIVEDEKFKNYEIGFNLSLDQIIEIYYDYLYEYKPYPKKLIPILEGKNGNYCLDYREIENKILKNPKITLFLENEVRNRRFVHIADSYEEFLNMIAINQEDIEKSQKILQKDFIYGSEVLNLLKE